jgi:hypothetical protein
MKTLFTILGLIIFFVWLELLLKKPDSFRPDTSQDQSNTRSNTQREIVKETIYVREDGSVPHELKKKKVQVLYYSSDYPGRVFKREDMHFIEELFPTGQMHGYHKPGSASERKYMERDNIHRRYNPDYTLTPVEY